MGLTNGVATIPGFVAPTIAGILAPWYTCTLDRLIWLIKALYVISHYSLPGDGCMIPTGKVQISAHQTRQWQRQCRPLSSIPLLYLDIFKLENSNSAHNILLKSNGGKKFNLAIVLNASSVVFYIASCVFVFGALIFLVFGKGNVQVRKAMCLNWIMYNRSGIVQMTEMKVNL